MLKLRLEKTRIWDFNLERPAAGRRPARLADLQNGATIQSRSASHAPCGGAANLERFGSAAAAFLAFGYQQYVFRSVVLVLLALLYSDRYAGLLGLLLGFCFAQTCDVWVLQ